jgi:hypothetical protein
VQEHSHPVAGTARGIDIPHWPQDHETHLSGCTRRFVLAALVYGTIDQRFGLAGREESRRLQPVPTKPVHIKLVVWLFKKKDG